MRTLRIIAGAILAYVVSVAMSFGWFSSTHHSSILPASVGFIALTVLWCIIQGLGTGWLARSIGASALSSYGTALLVFLFSIAGWVAAHTSSPVWSLVVAALVLAPATAAGGLVPAQTRQEAIA